MSRKRELTVEEVRRRVRYDPATGILTWTGEGVPPNVASRIRGKTAGTLHSTGHIRVVIDGSFYYAHRIAWAIMTGEWPIMRIDHEDTNPANNRWRNLREATNEENGRNQRLRKSNALGAKGVYFDGRRQRFVARIKVRYRFVYLGSFATAEEARRAYRFGSLWYHGKFGRVA